MWLILAVCAVAGLLAFRLARQRRARPASPPRPTRETLEHFIDPTAERDRLNPRPRAPEQTAEECWVPPGEAVRVGPYTVTRGMIYVGAGLYRDRRAWKPEDFLIDPTLKVSSEAPDHAGRTVSPWPAYHKLTPHARAAYLDWLADGARRPETPAGYVTLYLNGLRYRLRLDPPDAERARIQEEIDRLRRLYAA